MINGRSYDYGNPQRDNDERINLESILGASCYYDNQSKHEGINEVFSPGTKIIEGAYRLGSPTASQIVKVPPTLVPQQ